MMTHCLIFVRHIQTETQATYALWYSDNTKIPFMFPTGSNHRQVWLINSTYNNICPSQYIFMLRYLIFDILLILKVTIISAMQ